MTESQAECFEITSEMIQAVKTVLLFRIGPELLDQCADHVEEIARECVESSLSAAKLRG